jgi:predicted PurR-regulated permease PerM
MKIRLTVIILIIVLTVGSIVITTGYISNSKYVEIPNITNQYENLLKYKNELEKINQYNQEILKDLEHQLQDFDDVNINQINDEINVVKRVINENKLELEQIISKLSQMEETNP